MLVLTRRTNDKLLIAQGKIAVTVLGIHGGRVRLGISAPGNVAIRRGEIESTLPLMEVQDLTGQTALVSES